MISSLRQLPSPAVCPGFIAADENPIYRYERSEGLGRKRTALERGRRDARPWWQRGARERSGFRQTTSFSEAHPVGRVHYLLSRSASPMILSAAPEPLHVSAIPHPARTYAWR